MIQSAEERYPELDSIANELYINTIHTINEKCKTVESLMPYKSQCVLEMLISKLENSI